MDILISLFDKKVPAYQPPVAFDNVAHALRYYQSVLNKPTGRDPMWVQYPEDFDLYQIAEFHEKEGRLDAYEHPMFLEHMLSLRKESKDG